MDQKNPLAALRSPLLTLLIKDSLNYGYSSYGIPKQFVENIVSTLSDYSASPRLAEISVRHKILEGTSEGKDFISHFTEYKRYKKPILLFTLLGQYIRGPVIVEVGAGDCSFSKEVILRIKNVRKVIATEVSLRKTVERSDKITLKLLSGKDSTSIPVKQNSVDTILFINVLHHIPPSGTGKILRSAFKALRLGGKAIILEDSYSSDQLPVYNVSEILNTFMNLEVNQKKQHFRFMDWYTTKILENIPEIRHPFNFHSLEEWSKILTRIGFHQVSRVFLGICPGSSHAIPKGLLIAEK